MTGASGGRVELVPGVVLVPVPGPVRVVGPGPVGELARSSARSRSRCGGRPGA
ncbi:MAG: hypothetical protein ABSF03_20300 [Streptosporangiaceae bacterium]